MSGVDRSQELKQAKPKVYDDFDLKGLHSFVHSKLKTRSVNAAISYVST